jgi:hypothetical protein
MNLTDISLEIKDILQKRREEIELSFVEEDHLYFMKDLNGIVRNDYPSVSKVIKMFHPHFDSEKKALEMSNGNYEVQRELLNEWKRLNELSTNQGSRVHYELEKYLISLYGSYKEIRKPIFNINEEQRIKSDNMIQAGKEYIDLMHERGAVLLDTEVVLGDPTLGYTGQPDKFWLIHNKTKTDFGIVTTDWKTNAPKKFESQVYTKKMYYPFNKYDDTALGHYFIQLPLYGRLFLKMLEGSKYQNKKIFGNIVVLLMENSTFAEYRVPVDIMETIYTMDLTNYLK